MSLGELSVVLIIAILVIKPEDIPSIIKKLHNIREYINRLKSDVLKHLQLDKQLTDPLKEEAEQLNFYLKEIIDIEGDYKGEYSIEALKNQHEKLTKNNAELKASTGKTSNR